MKKILVALDFSKVSRNTFEYALLLAKTLKVELTVLNVMLPITDRGDYPEEILEFAKENEYKRANKQLKRLTTFYPNRDANEFIKHNISLNYLVKEGAIVPTIIETAKKLQIDLIISSTKTRNNLSKIILGSVAKELIRKTTIPVLIIPEAYTFQTIKNIAFATALDGKDEHAFLWLQRFAKELQSTIEPVFISELPYDYSNTLEEKWQSKSLRSEDGATTAVTVIRKATFNSGIDYYLEHHSANILAMFIPKRNFLNQLFHISKTQQMVAKINIPFLVYHA